jgi:hypothetical protein
MVWQEVKQTVSLQLKRKHFISHRQWLFDFLTKATELQATTLAVGCRHIWEALNDLCNTEVKPNPQRTCRKILAYVDQIRSHLFKHKPDKRCVSSPSPVKWTPPPLGFVMLNSDAAIFKDLGGMGVGVVGRGHLGACLVACRQFYSMLPEPEFAKAVALRQAASLARKKGLE